MKEISNRHFQLLVDKLPRVLDMIQKQSLSMTLRQQEDVRQLKMLHRQLRNKFNTKNN